MNDLIKRQDALKIAKSAYDGEIPLILVAECIEALPSADAEQVTSKLKNPCDSLLTEDSDECKEQKSKLESADAVEVVRCKDCRWQKISRKSGLANCGHEHGMMRADDNNFCSYGERREP